MFQFVIRFFLTFLKLHFLFNLVYFLIQPNFLTVIPIRSLIIEFVNLFDPIFPILILFFTSFQKFIDLLNSIIFSDLKFHFLLYWDYFLIQPNFLTVIPIRSIVIEFLDYFFPIFQFVSLFFITILKFTDLFNSIVYFDLKFHFLFKCLYFLIHPNF